MDPVGFGFENFNAIGQFRTKDGKFPIDASGTLPDGRSFKGAEDLKTLLSKDANRFAECVTDKMLTYALGRGLERYHRRTVKSIAQNLAASDYRFSSLVLEIVNSLPFQMARQERSKTDDHHRQAPAPQDIFKRSRRGDCAADARCYDAGNRKSAATKAPMRLAFTYIPNGVTMKDWKPAATGAELPMSPS